jgi:hypothetical protein
LLTWRLGHSETCFSSPSCRARPRAYGCDRARAAFHVRWLEWLWRVGRGAAQVGVLRMCAGSYASTFSHCVPDLQNVYLPHAFKWRHRRAVGGLRIGPGSAWVCMHTKSGPLVSGDPARPEPGSGSSTCGTPPRLAASAVRAAPEGLRARRAMPRRRALALVERGFPGGALAAYHSRRGRRPARGP